MIEFELKEKVRGFSYHVRITSPDGENFLVVENDKKSTVYESKEAFAKDFPELDSWFTEEDS